MGNAGYLGDDDSNDNEVKCDLKELTTVTLIVQKLILEFFRYQHLFIASAFDSIGCLDDFNYIQNEK